MNHCPWIDAFQVEFWETLEPPPGKRHDYQVLDLMGLPKPVEMTGQTLIRRDSARRAAE